MQLAENEVHVYTADLTLTPAQQATLWELLSEDERARAMRFVTPLHQQRFIAAHGVLRKLLAEYLSVAAKTITFTYSAHQKPALAKPHDSVLQFNFSHSGNLAAYAFTRKGAIGIDIESLQTDSKLDVAERFFSPAEITALNAAPAAEQARVFFRLWSRKEAIIKANGKGLSQPLSSFSVAATDTEESLTLEGENWYLYPLSVHPDFAAALATAEPVNELAIFKSTL